MENIHKIMDSFFSRLTYQIIKDIYIPTNALLRGTDFILFPVLKVHLYARFLVQKFSNIFKSRQNDIKTPCTIT